MQLVSRADPTSAQDLLPSHTNVFMPLVRRATNPERSAVTFVALDAERCLLKLFWHPAPNGEFVMNMSFKLLAAVVLTVGASPLAATANAAPIAAPSSLQNAAMSSVEAVQWRRGWRGRALVPGIAAGLIVGGAIAATQPWGGYGNGGYGYYDGYGDRSGYGQGYGYAPTAGYGYAPGPGYGYAPTAGYAYAPGQGYATSYEDGNDAGYCQQRFRSYDPSSGTYMGYDGLRHSCP
jgi:hypothetical protein